MWKSFGTAQLNELKHLTTAKMQSTLILAFRILGLNGQLYGTQSNLLGGSSLHSNNLVGNLSLAI